MTSPIKKEVTIGQHRLILGDCAEVMPLLERVDCIVTDPPYEFNASGGGIFRRSRRCLDEIQNNMLDTGFDYSLISQDICNSAFVFCHNDQIPAITTFLCGQFGRFALCAWHKSNPMPVANKHYKPDTEFYIHAWGRGGHPVGDLRYKSRYVISAVGQQNEFDHPTVKPIALMEKIIINANGETILDPFMGTATTGVACQLHGKKFIGIEHNEKYFDIACERMNKIYNNP